MCLFCSKPLEDCDNCCYFDKLLKVDLQNSSANLFFFFLYGVSYSRALVPHSPHPPTPPLPPPPVDERQISELRSGAACVSQACVCFPLPPRDSSNLFHGTVQFVETEPLPLSRLPFCFQRKTNQLFSLPLRLHLIMFPE